MMKKTLLSALLIGSISLTGCSTLSNLIEKPDDQKTVEDFYGSAMEAFEEKQWDVAIENYEKLKAYFPYGSYAEQTYLELAYAYYKYDESESAIRELDEFIRLYPNHPEIAYAYYLRAVSADSITRSWLDKFITDPATRDIKSAIRAYDYYTQLIQRFPSSKYAVAAAERLIVLRNQQARHEIQVAEFYMNKMAYLAAANRAKVVLTDFPRSASTAQALKILVTAYDKLGMQENKTSVEEVYKLNQDKIEFSEKTLEDMKELADKDGGWWNGLMEGLQGIF
ncbi:outer membrane protein assembly factor BamD [Thiomicrorhabdus indica]|uniref:outer membrane protein assembly factor BamD n=1 Tax=Thiomicrorhabdus indica TaxID=2267253 RepID=UPI00102D6C71|nr:outer membrane protein assembly factor BamD [Thiomicrorhabdus indica]